MIVDSRGNKLINTSLHAEYRYAKVGEVHSFLKPDVRLRLDKFLSAFKDFRIARNDRIIDKQLYPKLPYIDLDAKTWKNRQKDWEYLERKHQLSGKRILEIGSWNGWLANRLTTARSTVCAIDYFIDPFDGLGAVSNYPDSTWTTIQMDCEELDVLEPGFDMIIFNWNIMMFFDPWKVLDEAKALLSETGEIVVLGIIVVKNEVEAKAHFENQSAQFEKDYGVPFGLRSFKGFFKPADLQNLKPMGFKTTPYQRIKTKLKSFLKPSSAQVYRAVFSNYR